MKKNNKYSIMISLLLIISTKLSAQISTANQDNFNYEHLLMYNFAALVSEGDESKIDNDDKKLIKEYNFKGKDYRYIYWNRLPGDEMKTFLHWNIVKVFKIEHLEEKHYKGNFTLLTYRDCERGLVLQTRLWNDNKTVSISWEWFSMSNRSSSKYLIGCPVVIKNKSNSEIKSSNALYRGKKHNQSLNKK